MLNIKKNFDEEKNLWNVALEGEIDIYTSSNLKENLNEIIEERLEDILFDCEGLEYIDSTGLGVLIGTLKKLKVKDKNIIIKSPRDNILKLLKITGLDKIFLIE